MEYKKSDLRNNKVALLRRVQRQVDAKKASSTKTILPLSYSKIPDINKSILNEGFNFLIT